MEGMEEFHECRQCGARLILIDEPPSEPLMACPACGRNEWTRIVTVGGEATVAFTATGTLEVQASIESSAQTVELPFSDAGPNFNDPDPEELRERLTEEQIEELANSKVFGLLLLPPGPDDDPSGDWLVAVMVNGVWEPHAVGPISDGLSNALIHFDGLAREWFNRLRGRGQA